jgi:hypothetical protein
MNNLFCEPGCLRHTWYHLDHSKLRVLIFFFSNRSFESESFSLMTGACWPWIFHLVCPTGFEIKFDSWNPKIPLDDCVPLSGPRRNIYRKDMDPLCQDHPTCRNPFWPSLSSVTWHATVQKSHQVQSIIFSTSSCPLPQGHSSHISVS